MVCNALESAFLTTRKELLESLDSTMNKDFMEDAFLTWFEQNRKLLSCPDVMFDVSRDEQVRPEEFTKMFGKRELNRWIIDGGQDIWFGCSRGTAHVPHGLHCRKSSGMGLPPCCMESLADSIKFVMSTCEKYNIICELQEGTLLGAVKFQGVLPWERDADITFLSGNYSALKNLSEYFASNGFSLHDSPSYKQWCCADGRIAGGAFRLAAHGWTIELWGQHLMDSELRIMVGEQPSKVFFAGQWVNVPDNPGLYARNRYGHNNLRHAEHWMATGKASGWDTYNSGKFSACANPGHHGCLDQFHADGSLQFG
ncbi:uncharacterized protein LOC134180399 [Corticium candelabrum]|uniref:uncharacterized protein LOC134180399 n=1 Tax=Corticium candelabrum TaxID=121492 RepID=UPI002E255CC3|nr:uncharacterized protein LOC134180399 [Corticium candelabrum]